VAVCSFSKDKAFSATDAFARHIDAGTRQRTVGERDVMVFGRLNGLKRLRISVKPFSDFTYSEGNASSTGMFVIHFASRRTAVRSMYQRREAPAGSGCCGRNSSPKVGLGTSLRVFFDQTPPVQDAKTVRRHPNKNDGHLGIAVFACPMKTAVPSFMEAGEVRRRRNAVWRTRLAQRN
jgi:hypothetical protein